MTITPSAQDQLNQLLNSVVPVEVIFSKVIIRPLHPPPFRPISKHSPE